MSDEVSMSMTVESTLAALVDLATISTLVSGTLRVRLEVTRVENLHLLLGRLGTGRRILRR